LRGGPSGPDAGLVGSREGRETAGDGIDNPYRVEERLGAKPQVAAAAQRQPGARVDKPYRLGADGGRGRCRTLSHRWKSRAMSDAFASMVARAMSDAFASSRAVPSESTTNGSFPPRGGSQANVGR
jgi:hypothetical protein